MRVEPTKLDGVCLIVPDVFGDARGFFMETWNARRYREHGITADFVQDNVSFSQGRIVRGLHYQKPTAQAKLISVLEGEIFDVAVDIRVGSPTFGTWASAVLSSENKHQFFVPEGFAHGFMALSPTALVHYKCSDFYDRQAERSLRWDDPDVGIDWPAGTPLLSDKDAAAPFLRDIPPEHLFSFEGN